MYGNVEARNRERELFETFSEVAGYITIEKPRITRQRVDRNADLVVGVRKDTPMRDRPQLQPKSGQVRTLAPRSAPDGNGGDGLTVNPRARLTVDEIARRLDIGRLAVYTMLEQGIIPSVRLGRRWIVTRHAFENWERTCGIPTGIPTGLQRKTEQLMT